MHLYFRSCLIAPGYLSTALLNPVLALDLASDIELTQNKAEHRSSTADTQPAPPAEAEKLFRWQPHLLWESRYVTEGRDNLAGKAITSLSSEFSLGKLSIVPWIANSAAADYREIDLSIVYSLALSTAQKLSIGYTAIVSDNSTTRSYDNELSLELSHSWNLQLSSLTSIYYSFDATGAFVTFAIEYTQPLAETLQLNVQTIIGANAGYISNGHSGPNNAQLVIRIANEFTDQLEAYAYLSYSLAINRNTATYPGDATLGDFGWGGTGLTYRF